LFGETLRWTGASSSSNNFSDQANWSPSQVPANDDHLIFSGETRTNPYNDLDPEAVSFASITFENDGSEGKRAEFTISGNTINMKGSIGSANAPSSAPLTETFETEIVYTGTSNFTLSSDNVTHHHIVFNKKVSGPVAKNIDLYTPTQHRGNIYFNGGLEGFRSFRRPNGSGHIYFNSANNAFDDDEGGYNFNQGWMYFVDAATFGPARYFRSGQGGWATAGGARFNLTNDTVISARIGLTSPSQNDDAFTVESYTAGKTLTLLGEVYECGTKENAGTRLVVTGAGDGILKGNFSTNRIAFTKKGTGTWTLAEEIGTSVMTGLVQVTAGKLVIDCTLAENQRVEVSANATLAGKGTLGAMTHFNGGAIYEIGGTPDSLNILTAAGTVNLAGDIVVKYAGGSEILPGSQLEIMRFAEKTGVGNFTLGAGFPAGTTLKINGSSLSVAVPSEVLVWNGSASDKWNKQDANWAGAFPVFRDGASVEFPDLADGSKRTIDIPAAVSPMSLSVFANAANPYSFTGEGPISNANLITFSGTAINALDTDVENATAIEVSDGGLVLTGDIGGDVPNCFITIGKNATLTQGVESVIGGSYQLSAYGPNIYLCGTNTYAGGTIVGLKDTPGTQLYVSAPNGIGTGDLTIGPKSTLNCNSYIAVTNKTAYFYGPGSVGCVNLAKGHLEWRGDIHILESGRTVELIKGSENPNANNIILGKEDGTSVLSFYGYRNTTIVGTIYMHSRLLLRENYKLAFRGTLYLYSTNNEWGGLSVNTGKAVMMAENALSHGELSMLQQWNNAQYEAVLDLNGFDQTVSGISITDYNKAIYNKAEIRSEAHAVLTVSNDTDSVFNDVATFKVKEFVSLRKMGAGVWTVGCENTSTGNIEIVEGTVSVVAEESMPVGKDSFLRIHDGAFLDLPDGIAAEIGYAEKITEGGAKTIRAGLYGGANCKNASAAKVDWITGEGTLLVRRDQGGTIVVVR
jgi:autotransporter-associated beta strand protein